MVPPQASIEGFPPPLMGGGTGGRVKNEERLVTRRPKRECRAYVVGAVCIVRLGQYKRRFYAVALCIVNSKLAQPRQDVVVLDELRDGLLAEEVADLVD